MNEIKLPEVGGNGVSTLTGFRYFKGLCHVSLANGAKGIVGDSTDFPFPVMLGLKGQSTSLKWTRKPDESKDGETYQRYELEWSVA